MQIKPYDGATSPSPASVRPPDVSQLTTKPLAVEGRIAVRESDIVSLSDAGRTLAMALSKLLPEIEGVRVSELLTPRDRFVVVKALELVRVEQLDPEQVQKLIVDLYRFRVQERLGDSFSLPAAQHPLATVAQDVAGLTDNSAALHATRGPNSEALRGERPATAHLALPRFNARDEEISHAILASLSLRDTAIDRNFVRSLLDPDRQRLRSVDFLFLRRLVVALSPSNNDGARDPHASLAPRLARTVLAEAISLLALAKSELPEATAETFAEGRSLLKDRLSALEPRERVPGSKPLLLQLRASDRTLLGMLYVAAKDRQIDAKAVDDVAQALLTLRRAEDATLTPRGRTNPSVAPSVVPHAGRPATPPPRTETPSAAAARLTDDTLARGPERFDPRLSAPPTPGFAWRSDGTLAEGALTRQERTLATQAVEPRATDAAEDNVERAPLSTRPFGSTSQIAARFSDTYRSLAPIVLPGPAELEPDSRLGAAASAPLAAAAAQPFSTGARPLDLGQILGLSALLTATRAQGRRALRSLLRSTPRAAIHAVTAAREAASEAEADDPVHEDARRRRRTRWLLLIQRRKHSRRHKS